VSLIFLIFFTIPLYSQTFGGRQRVFTGPNPYGIKAVDVNKDGNQDIIWFSSEHNVEIRLGLGDGRFASSGPIYNTMLTHAGEFEAADMNRDGHLDIVVVGNHSIAVLRGNGDGTFQTPLLFSISNAAEPGDPSDAIDSLALGDFNKDGKVDALVSIGSSIQIAFGKGDGTFQSPAKVFPNGLQGHHYQFQGQLSNNAESGDFDGDGNLDLAFYTCCDDSDDSLLFGGTLWAWYGDGRGNFPVKKVIQTDLDLVRIKVFDINQDGKKDILYSWKRCHDSCADGVTSLLYAGSRTFTSQGTAISSAAGYSIETGVTFGDFDLDGVLDLMTGANSGLPGGFFLFRRHTNGTIEDAQFRDFGLYGENEPSEVISADFNNDGKNDLALSFSLDNSILIFGNTTTPPGPCASGLIRTVHICTPVNNETTNSPVHVSARADSDRTVTGWKIYVDGVAKSSGTGSNIEASIVLGSSSSTRRIEVKTWDSTGRTFSSSVSITVQ
jgi:hypothetical protein